MNVRSHISSVLVPLLIACPVWAESPVFAPADEAVPAALQLRLLDSDGSNATVNARSSKGITVQVTDANGVGVADAAVAFRFPDSGSTALFRDGSHSAVAYTDRSGSARVSDFQWNNQPGQLALRVTATKANTHAGLLIEQTLSAPAGAIPVATPAPAAPVVQTAAVPAPATPLVEMPAVALNRPNQPVEVSETVAPLNPYRSARLGVAPAISTSSTDRNLDYHGSIFANKKRWIILGILAGVGVGAALALSSKSGSSAGTTSSSSVSVGSPTITIGHP